MRVATWNLERKKPTSPRGAEAVDYLHWVGADLFVVTEARTSFPAGSGHLLFADEIASDRFGDDERKVGLWSSAGLEPLKPDSPIDKTRIVAATAAPGGLPRRVYSMAHGRGASPWPDAPTLGTVPGTSARDHGFD